MRQLQRRARNAPAPATGRELLRPRDPPLPRAAVPAGHGHRPAAVCPPTPRGIPALPHRPASELCGDVEPRPPPGLGAAPGGPVRHDGVAARDLRRRPQPADRTGGRALAGPLPPDSRRDGRASEPLPVLLGHEHGPGRCRGPSTRLVVRRLPGTERYSDYRVAARRSWQRKVPPTRRYSRPSWITGWAQMLACLPSLSDNRPRSTRASAVGSSRSSMPRSLWA